MDTVIGTALLTDKTPLLAIWLLGVSLGLTACTATCLPFMGTWVLGRGGNHLQALRDTGLFVTGRILAYALLGALAGGMGVWLTQAMRSGAGNLFIAVASIAAGLWLLRSNSMPSTCSVARRAGTSAPILLGFSLSLTPCAPLASLLAVCAAAGSIQSGLFSGIMFGLGAALTPLLILLPLLGLLGRNLRADRPWITHWIRWSAAAVLILLGLRRIFLVI